MEVVIGVDPHKRLEHHVGDALLGAANLLNNI
jgi:hypothetical protein